MQGNRGGLSVSIMVVCIWLPLCLSAVAAEPVFNFPWSWFSVPSAPTLSVTIDGDQATLRWDSVTPAKGYRLCADHAMGKDFDGTFDLNWDLGTTTSVTVTLWPGADFYCGVTAYSAVGESGFSNIVGVGLPPAPPTLTLTTGEDQSILSWGAVAGARRYRLYADHAGQAPFDGAFDLSWNFQTTSLTVKLWPGADVYIAVTAHNAAGESGYSKMVRLFPAPADTDWVSIAAGTYHSVALKADGSLWAWGRNHWGELGDGTHLARVTPTQIGEEKDWVTIFAGDSQTFAIKADGTLWGWGSNSSGQLGDGTKEHRSVPTRIGMDHDWATLSTQGHNTVAVKADGTLWAWGNMNNPGNWFMLGPLPVQWDENKVSPTRVGQDTDWVSVTASNYFALALKSDHTLWRWGGDYLSSSIEAGEPEPVRIGNEADWRSVSAGYEHVVALKTDGTIWTWGSSALSALGIGAPGDAGYVTNPTDPIQISSSADWIFVHAGLRQTFAVKSDGTLWAWGINSQGQLGDRPVPQRNIPTQVGFDGRWRAVATGYNHALAIQNDGTLWAWGRGEYGERGDGIESTDRDVPVQIAPGIQWRSAAAGFEDSYAIDNKGALFTWGERGRLRSVVLIQLGSDLDWSTASGGTYHAVAIKTDGTLWGWSRPNYGLLNDEAYFEALAQPIRIGSDSDWGSVDAGYFHTMAVKTDGTLWAWGQNDEYQLGDRTTETRDIPVQIDMDSDWVAAATSPVDRAHTVALRADGTLLAWGNNAEGQLGDGTTENKHYPVQVGSDVDWKMVAAGLHHTAAIKEDHGLWAWGLNAHGQLGDGTRLNRPIPVQVGDSKDWRTVAAGFGHTAGIKLDGTLWIWGAMSLGQVGGLNSLGDRPVQYETDTDWESVSSGINHMLALKRDGSLWAFGRHGYAKIEPVNVVLGADQQ